MFRLTLTQQTIADAPRDAVWQAFADIESWPRWNAVCLSVRVMEGEPWVPGFRFRMVLRMARVPVPFEPRVVDVQPATRVVWSSTRFTITGTRTFAFEDAGPGKTLVTDEKVFTSPVLPVPLFYPRPVIKRMSEAWLASLAAEAARRANPTS